MKFLCSLVLTLSVFSLSPAMAQPGPTDRAREARESGEYIPLKTIIRKLEREYGGSYLNARLQRRADQQSHYIIDWLTEDGRKLKIALNAHTGRTIRMDRSRG